MNAEPVPLARTSSDLQAEAAFKDWVRRLIKGAAELHALDTGQVDAIVDPATGTAILLPEAQAALRGAVVTRENVRERNRIGAARRSVHTKASRIHAMVQAAAANSLLATLPAKDQERLLAGADLVKLTYGEVLYEPGEQMQHVYFPVDCLVSLLTVVDGRRALEVGLVGREGMVGSRVVLGINTASVRGLVQGTGMAMRMKSARFLREFRRSSAMQRALFRFTDALMIQVTQTAACNRFHTVAARLARWLLMTRDRLPPGNFHLTHEFLADMLGVRRVGVTSAASALQRRKVIRYQRGTITILDQQGLEDSCCSCYQHVKLMELEAATRSNNPMTSTR